MVASLSCAAGDNVLIHAGSGAIGGMAVQIAKHIGCTVTATCSAANTDYVRDLGADRVVAYDVEDFSEIVTSQDAVFDLLGGETHEKSCRILKPGGRLVWLIAAPFDDVSGNYDVTCTQAMIHDRRETLENVAEAVAKGILKPQVSRRLPHSQAAEAHRILERGENSRGRIILNIGE